MVECAVVGPHLATGGEPLRLDVVVRGAPSHGALRIRLERLDSGPAAHIDEWCCPGPRTGTITCSFLWRPAAASKPPGRRPVVLRASVRGARELCSCTHRIEVVAPRRPSEVSFVRPLGSLLSAATAAGYSPRGE
ncbi:MAG: hypothetical protein ACOC97_04245 [Myxococcota bacterium]